VRFRGKIRMPLGGFKISRDPRREKKVGAEGVTEGDGLKGPRRGIDFHRKKSRAPRLVQENSPTTILARKRALRAKQFETLSSVVRKKNRAASGKREKCGLNLQETSCRTLWRKER